jgi:acyl-CoA synthetase (NDP forming)
MPAMSTIHPTTAPPLECLFEPRSIAVVGASDNTERMGGGMVLRFIQDHGFSGALYPVNPKRQRVGGLECHPNLESVPGPIDLAVLAVPAAAIPGVFAAMPEGHVRIAQVMTSGFAELDEEGADLEHEMIAAARAKGVRIVGPNSVGTANLWSGVVPSFSQFFDRTGLTPGEVALVSQSGAFGTAILAGAEQAGIRFGHFVSSGNETDLEFCDFGRHLLEQERVKAVCGYIESVKKGDAFVAFARRAAALGKPIIVLKVGASQAGATAARSHTGALVGSDTVAQAMFDALNVVRAADGEDLLDLARMFARTPPGRGRNLAVLTHSGGAGVMAVDAAEAGGCAVPPLPEGLAGRLADMLPAFATIANPLDMTGGAAFQGKLMADCMRAMLADDAYDAALLCVNLIWRDGPALMNELADIAASTDKPFAVSWVAPEADAARLLRDAPYPVYGDPARTARALTRRLVFDARCRALAAAEGDDDAPEVGPDASLALDGVAAQGRVLAAFGIRLPGERVCADVAEAEDFRLGKGVPVALKVASPDIAHRTEIGAVVTGIDDGPGLARAFDGVLAAARRHAPEARIEGVLVQEMVTPGLEVLIGVKRDPVFGPMVAFGPGGTLVELMGGVALHPAPFGVATARRLIAGSRLAPLLDGYRGGARLDADGLAETLSRVSHMAARRADIAELDLNPVAVLETGCVALDYKFTPRQVAP